MAKTIKDKKKVQTIKIDGLEWYSSAKQLGKEKFIEVHLTIKPYSTMPKDLATEELESVFKKI